LRRQLCFSGSNDYKQTIANHDMKKRLIISIIIFLIIAINFLSINVKAIGTSEISKGSNWETSCIGNECQTTLYSYEKYWHNEQGEWEEIDENWFDCSEGLEVKFCTKEYYYKAVISGYGEISAIINGENITFKLDNLLGSGLGSVPAPVFNPVIEGSVFTFENIMPNIDLRYQYLPSKLKEEIVIKEPLQNIQQDFNISFQKHGTLQLTAEEPYICDASFYCQYLSSSISDNQINIQIPASFLNNLNIAYPLVIDPTLNLNWSFIAWNGYINNNSNNHTRFNNPSLMIIAGSSSNHYRAAVDWNVSSIPDQSIIRNVTVSLYSTAPQFPYNVSLYHMGSTNNTYPNVDGDCPNGNCLYYSDMGNGTEYNKTTVNQKNIYRNYTLPASALSDLQAKLTSDIFSIGFAGEGYNGIGTISIGSRDYVTTSLRPMLIITHSYESYDLTYDANGNMIQGFNKYLEYDGWHRVSKIRQNNATGNVIEEYTYDHEGKRIKKIEYRNGNQSDNETTYYSNSKPADFIQVRNASGIFNFTYYYLNDKMIASKFQNGDKLYYHPDHLGSTTLVTNQSGDVVEDNVFGPFGCLHSGDESERYLFTGQERDETGFDDFGARLYYCKLMHWLRWDDPAYINVYNPQNLNKYSYALNNPYRYTDPTGNYVSPLDIVDYISLAQSIQAYNQNPSLTNGIFLGLDAVSAIVPLVGGLGAAARGVKYAERAIGEAGAVDNILEKVGKQGADNLGNKASKEITVNPQDVRYTHDNIKGTFQDGKSVDQTISDLKSGAIQSSDIPQISVVNQNGNLYSLDNRRLYSFKEAGINKVNAVLKDLKNSKVWKEYLSKKTTKNDGTSIKVKKSKT